MNGKPQNDSKSHKMQEIYDIKRVINRWASLQSTTGHTLCTQCWNKSSCYCQSYDNIIWTLLPHDLAYTVNISIFSCHPPFSFCLFLSFCWSRICCHLFNSHFRKTGLFSQLIRLVQSSSLCSKDHKGHGSICNINKSCNY